MMAYRKKNFRTKKNYSRRSRVTMGKKFRTRRGRYGCYKYVNGRKVAFVTSRRY